MNQGFDYLVRRLRLRHLELLVVLHELGTMRGAASRLNLSQPAISKMLVEAEESLGGPLFERTRQGVQATEMGLAAVHRARVAMGELAHAHEEIAAMRGGASAVLRVGTFSVTSVVPAAVVALRRRLPQTSVRLHEGRVGDLIQRLLDGDLDCVFGALTAELLNSGLLPQLQSDMLVDDRLCVLAADTHPLAGRRRSKWADLKASNWVAPPRGTLVRQAFMTAFLNQGLDPPEPVIEAMSSVTIGTVLRLDASLLGAVRLEHARDEVARGGLRQLAVAPAIAMPPLGVFTRRGSVGPPEVLLEFARALRKAGGRPLDMQVNTCI